MSKPMKIIASAVCIFLLMVNLVALAYATLRLVSLGRAKPLKLAFALSSDTGRPVSGEEMKQAVSILRSRLDALGVADPVVEGREDGSGVIEVLLPPVRDTDRIKNTLQAQSRFELKFVASGAQVPYSTRQAAEDELKRQPGGESQYEITSYSDRGAMQEGYLVVEKNPVITSPDMRDAFARRGSAGAAYEVDFVLTSSGAQKFGDATSKRIGDSLAIMLNHHALSAPVVHSRIEDRGVISGNFTERQAEDLALLLRSGALPGSLKLLSEETASSNPWIRKYGVLSGALLVTFFALIFGLIRILLKS